MTESPFGGFDFNAILGKAAEMQSSMLKAQEQLAESTVTGTVGGGAVSVTLNGVGDLIGVDIKTGEFDGTDADNLTDLSDLIVAAFRDAKAQAEALASQSFNPLAGGLGGLGGLAEGSGLSGLGDLGSLLGGGAKPSTDGNDQRNDEPGAGEPPMKLGF